VVFNTIYTFFLVCAYIDSLYKCEGSSNKDSSSGSEDKGSSSKKTFWDVVMGNDKDKESSNDDEKNDSEDKPSSNDDKQNDFEKKGSSNDGKSNDSEKEKSSNDDKSNDSEKEEEEESYEIEEEIQNTRRLRTILWEAISLDPKLPESEKLRNSYLNELKKDPLVKEYLQGEELTMSDLEEMDGALSEAENESKKDLAEAKLNDAREAELKAQAMSKGKGRADDCIGKDDDYKDKGKGKADDSIGKDDDYKGNGKRKAEDYIGRPDGPSNWRKDDDYNGRPDGPSNWRKDDDYKGKGDGPSNSRFHESNNTLNNNKDSDNFSDYKQDNTLQDLIDILTRFFS